MIAKKKFFQKKFNYMIKICLYSIIVIFFMKKIMSSHELLNVT